MANHQPANPSRPRAPNWWTREHDTAWQQTRDTVRDEWERHPADEATTTGSAVGDFLTQMTGHPDLHYPRGEDHLGIATSETAATTMGSAPSREDWERAEPAIRYGHGAYHQYGRDHTTWTEQLEQTLRREWTAMCGSDGWHDVREFVRHGWNSARRKR